ncbi:lipopolysaccharide biosynthesis protein [Chengkuizengella sp. SCS-71B]|uniref:lipopolysaccharide biosynthesis protein n=1 Tax=Chengkuizengella sp. SCS-71B TaxID=3115290 RepID=UPI0032C245A0
MSLLVKMFTNKNAKAGSFYLIGNLFNKAIAFITIPIFTRLMSTSDYGIVNTYLSWVSILSLIVGLSLGNSLRSAYIDYKEDLEGYISSIFFLSLLNFIISSTLIIVISHFFFEKLDITLVILCLVQSFMTFILNSITIKYMLSVNYIKRTLLLALPNVIVSILSIFFLINMNDNQYLGRIIPYVITTSLIAMYYLVKIFIQGKKYIDKTYWKYAIILSLPLIFHGLSATILRTSDLTMLTAFRSTSEAGIYSLVYNLSMISLVITSSLESVWIPWFNKKLLGGERESINKNVKIYIELVVIAMIGILLISPEVLVIIAPKEYWSGDILIPLVLLASFFIFLYSISVNLEYFYKSIKIIATNTFIAAALNLVLNLILIPSYGYIAAAFTTVIAYAVTFGIHYYAARKLDNLLFPFKIYIKPIITMILAVIISYLIIDYAIFRWLIAFVGSFIYILVSFRKNRFTALLK